MDIKYGVRMRRRPRVSFEGVVLMACMGSAFGDSHAAPELPKQPPPPPPRRSSPTNILTARDASTDTLASEHSIQRTHPPPLPPLRPPPPPPLKSVEQAASTGSSSTSTLEHTELPLMESQRNSVTRLDARKLGDNGELGGMKSKSRDDKINEDFSLGDNQKDVLAEGSLKAEDALVSPVSQIRRANLEEEEEEEDVVNLKDQWNDRDFQNVPRFQFASADTSPDTPRMLPENSTLKSSDFGRNGPPSTNSRPPTATQFSQAATNDLSRPPESSLMPQMRANALPHQSLRVPRDYEAVSVARHSIRHPQHRGVPRVSRPSRRSESSTWKSIWGKVERGLDELANLEDVVSSRAHEMISSVAPQRRSDHHAQQSAPSWAVSRSTLAKRREMKPGPAVEDLRPYGKKYEQAKDRQQAKTSNTPSNATPERTIYWNDRSAGQKMLRANGGASEPTNTLPHKSTSFSGNNDPLPQNQQTQLQQPLSSPQSVDQKQEDKYSSELPARPSPYQQPRELQSPPPSRSSPEQTRRDSRIPWQEQSSTGQKRQMMPPPNARKEAGEDMEMSWKSRLARLMPPIPRFPSPRAFFRKKDPYLSYSNLDAWKADDEDERGGGLFGIFGRRPDSKPRSPSRNRHSHDSELTASPVASLMRRCGDGKKLSLLNSLERSRCRSVGRSRAALDIFSVMFTVLGLQQLRGLPGNTLSSSTPGSSPEILISGASLLVESMMTWAPYAFAVAYLFASSNKQLFENKTQSLASVVSRTVKEEAQYAQLYLRLYCAVPLGARLPERMEDASFSQVVSLVSSSRLHGFVTFILASLVVMTISVVRPMVVAVCGALADIVLQDGWQKWPFPWTEIASTTKEVIFSLVAKFEELLAGGVSNFLDSPAQFVFHLTVFGSLLAISFLPTIEEKRTSKAPRAMNDDGDDDSFAATELTEQLANLGTSSASRLSMLSMNGSVETALERWQVVVASLRNSSQKGSLTSSLRLVGHMVLAAIIALLPVIVSIILSASREELSSVPLISWDSLLDVSAVLCSVLIVAFPACRDAIESVDSRSSLLGFLALLSDTVNEINNYRNPQSDIQFAASVSPTAGLTVSDLWAAHTTKRAWAVRGASLSCKNGEVLVLLGDDGSGKTRLLTAIAEAMLNPPKRALTSNKVRGSVALGGLDISKWDRNVVKRRLGLLLSDVRTVSDIANLVSGLTLEEILEPIDPSRRKGTNVPSKLSSAEKSAMVLGLKVRKGIFIVYCLRPCAV